jgi:hypothetical protein
MISSRHLLALSVAGVVAIGLALWVSSRNSGEPPAATGPVLPGLEPQLNSVSEVRLTKGDGTRATLRKGATQWQVAERGFPADSGRVRKLLINLADLQVEEPKTRDPASYPELGVEDVGANKNAGGTRIDLIEPKGAVSIIVGKPSGTNASFVRVAGSAQSVLATPQLIPDADPRRWLDNAVLDLPQDKVKQVEVQPGSRTAATQTDFTVSNLPKGRELSSASAADPVAGSLASLTLDDVRKAAAAQSTAADTAHAVFHTFDGLVVDVAGRKEGDLRYIRLSAHADAAGAKAQADALAKFDGWELAIPGYKYDAVFRPMDELLKPLPEKPKPQKAHAATPGSTPKATPLSKAPPRSPAPAGAAASPSPPASASPPASPAKPDSAAASQ